MSKAGELLQLLDEANKGVSFSPVTRTFRTSDGNYYRPLGNQPGDSGDSYVDFQLGREGNFFWLAWASSETARGVKGFPKNKGQAKDQFKRSGASHGEQALTPKRVELNARGCVYIDLDSTESPSGKWSRISNTGLSAKLGKMIRGLSGVGAIPSKMRAWLVKHWGVANREMDHLGP